MEMKIESCPRCGKAGSLVKFRVVNERGKVFKPYFRVTHYSADRYATKKYHTESHYIPKKQAEALLKELRKARKKQKKRKAVRHEAR
jgi:Zn-finger nucleic acid-binding protein